jgi:hypothetical protein
VAVETADALRLPCAVVLAELGRARPLAGVRPGDPVVAGDRSLRLGALTVQVVRWWAPVRPRGAVPLSLRPHGGAPVSWDSLVLSLLGLGPGLTPAGDDLLAGLLVGLAGRPDLRDPLADSVARHAPGRTTWLSAELLHLAADGLAVPAVVTLADALSGHGADDALAGAARAVLAVGHSSGPALARGLLLAAETAAAHTAETREAA